MKYRWMKMMGLVFAVVLTTALFGCSDDDPTDPGGGDDPDTTAPRVDMVAPLDGALMVPSGQAINIIFNEPMDPASATGQITLSHGTVERVISNSRRLPSGQW
jgi:hypothetical protein